MRRQWFAITRSLQEIDTDTLRERSGNIPSKLDGTTMLLVKQGTQPVREYIYGNEDDLKSAGDLAGFSIAPLSDDQDEPELPDGIDRMAHPLVPWRARLNSQSNMERLRTNLAGMRDSIETLMPPDSYVSFTLRKQGYFEQMRIRNWISDEHATVEDDNELAQKNTMCMRISAGCADGRLSKSLAKDVGSAAFYLMSEMDAHTSHPRFGMFLSGIISILLTSIAILVSPLPFFIPQTHSGVLIPMLAVAVVTALTVLISRIPIVSFMQPSQIISIGSCALAYLLMLMLPIPSWLIIPCILFTAYAGFRWSQWTVWDDIMQKPRRYYAFSSNRNATDSDKETKLGARDNRPVVSGYGTQRTTLIISPARITALYTPLQSAGARTQGSHPVPDTLSSSGVYLGDDETGRHCYLRPDQLYGGIAISGEAGSGKTVLTHGIAQWAVTAREHTSEKIWGADSRLIMFWMKDDTGVGNLAEYRSEHGITTPQRVIYVADPSSRGIDMLGIRDGKNAKDTAVSIAATMQYSFEQGDILNDSLNIITQAMTIGVTATRFSFKHPGVIVDRCHQLEQQFFGAGQLKEQQSPIGWATVALCGSDGQIGSARALGQVLRALALEYAGTEFEEDLTLSSQAAEQLYGRPDQNGRAARSDRDILQRTNASLNKVNQFLPIEHVFTLKRANATWAKILNNPGDYHIVLSEHDGHSLPERMDKILGAWLLYRLWNTIAANCKGWLNEGKHTMLICDELSMLANGNDDILQKMREQGRSFGLMLVFATQYPKQLSPILLDSFMGYSTFISYSTMNNEIAQLVANRLTDAAGEDGWTPAAIMNLPKYTAAVRSRTQDQLQPSFLVKIHNFDD
ncbi:type IV secretory system conjugative DNA transfer family protein [Bifidobacterium sp. SO1]|uniref:type IV secretory system conjugative DNA transfer family protein n=1 Tax=Bifidobacterium sp. SO1 TaxID=2809029 RepID=UPI001BDCCEC5|nr:type IV secretory system conjugative DNA transfer family protein [Bifidobacterium sp. SO1]MBT1162146.1 AAA family ATPase [Bifidobacterium sp. SO1]